MAAPMAWRNTADILTRSINWIAAKRLDKFFKVSPLAQMRSQYEMLDKRINDVPEKQPEINWDMYAEKLGSHFDTAALKKKYDADVASCKIDEAIIKKSIDEQLNYADTKLIPEVSAFVAQTKIAVGEAEKQLSVYDNGKPLEEMTIKEYLEMHPDIELKHQEIVESGMWLCTDLNEPPKKKSV